jgi:hypothetical protein
VSALQALGDNVGDWVQVIRLQTQEILGADGQPIGAVASPEDLERVERLQQRVEFAVEHLEDEGVRGLNLLDRVAAAALAIWNTELYLAEEVSSLGGQKVTTFRAVTLGKLLRLVGILALGWFLLRFLAGSVRRLVAARTSRRQPRKAAGNWTFGIGIALLVIVA